MSVIGDVDGFGKSVVRVLKKKRRRSPKKRRRKRKMTAFLMRFLNRI